MKILKFGGTSVGSEENIRRIGEIVASQSDRIIIVVSALGGVTDKLLSIAKNSVSGLGAAQDLVGIWDRHKNMVDGLLEKKKKDAALFSIRQLYDELEKIVQGVNLTGELTPKTLDKVLGFGERKKAS